MQRTQEPEILGVSSSKADSAQDIIRDKEGHRNKEESAQLGRVKPRWGLRVELDGCFHKHAASKPVQ